MTYFKNIIKTFPQKNLIEWISKHMNSCNENEKIKEYLFDLI